MSSDSTVGVLVLRILARKGGANGTVAKYSGSSSRGAVS